MADRAHKKKKDPDLRGDLQGQLFGTKSLASNPNDTQRSNEVAMMVRSTEKAPSIAVGGVGVHQTKTAPPPSKKPRKRRSAAELASGQREISVSEFFSKNRHLLGFDSPSRALLTAVKEAVDNALDACEEAGTLPELFIGIEETGAQQFRVVVEDNGPGILKAQVPKIFGKLLYGSKFHVLRQSRGQQGIGISAAGMYGQLTTGKPVAITTRVQPRRAASYFELMLDTARNKPKLLLEEERDWAHEGTGTRVEIELEGTYRQGSRSVDRYVALTHMANPHCDIRYQPPRGDPVEYPRSVHELPVEPKAIKPHPYGVELGVLMKMLQVTQGKTVGAALQLDFSRVSAQVAAEIAKVAKVRPSLRPRAVTHAQAIALHEAMAQVRILAPPTACISPIGEQTMVEGMKASLTAEGYEPGFITSCSRRPAIYRGNPFLVEIALAWGGNLPADGLARLHRFANRVPLQYQQSACAISKAVTGAGWRSYGVQQARGALPTGPLVIFAHIASVWVPFTSESKEAIASYDEILKEFRLGLQACGRRLSKHLRRRKREADELRKRSHIQVFIPVIGEALQEILLLSDSDRDKTVERLTDILNRSRKDT